MKIDGSGHFERFSDLRRRVARLCEFYPSSYWRNLDSKRLYPSEFLRALTQFRFNAIAIPEEFGGEGLGIAATCAAVEEMHYAGCDSAKSQTQYALVSAITRYGTDRQRRRWLSDIAIGVNKLQACSFLDENRASHEERGFSVKLAAGTYLLSGHCTWPEKFGHSNLAVVVASNEQPDGGSFARQLAFIVNVSQVGLGMALRPRWTSDGGSKVDLVAERAVVARSEMLGTEKDASSIVNCAQFAKAILESAARVGDAKYLFKRALIARVRDGIESEARVGALDKIRVAEIAISRAAGLFDEGSDCKFEVNQAGQQSVAALVESVGLSVGDSEVPEYDQQRTVERALVMLGKASKGHFTQRRFSSM